MLADHGRCNGHESNESTLILVTLTLVNNVNSQHQYLRWWAPTCHLLLPRHFWLKSFNCSMNAPGSFNSMSSKYSRRPIFTPITSTGAPFDACNSKASLLLLCSLHRFKVRLATYTDFSVQSAIAHGLAKLIAPAPGGGAGGGCLDTSEASSPIMAAIGQRAPSKKKRVVWVWDWDVWSLKSEVVCLTVVCCWTDCIVWHCLHSRLACTCLPCQPACSLSLWGQNWQNIFCDYYCNGSRFHHRSMMKSEWQVQKLAYDCCSWAR